jgi:hypothetical protein
MTVDVLRAASANDSPAAWRVSAPARRTRAVLEMDPVLDEIERRAAIGLGGILNKALLEALLNLPVDLPVPIQALDTRTIRTLTAAPAGCIDFSNDVVVRRAVSPIRVLRAGVCAARWSDGLSQAGQFASYCSRYAVLTSDTADLDHAVMEARYYGIGLATMIDGPESLKWLVHPALFRPTRETVASWHFAESALDAMSHSVDLASE